MRWTLVVAGLAWFGCPAASASDQIQAKLAQFNQNATYPIPTLTNEQLDLLRAGKLVRIRITPKSEGEHYRGIGLKIIAQPRAQLWAGAVDPHMASKGTASEVEMPTEGPGSRWYQRLWLPWPFAQRHWVIDVNDTHRLAQATNDVAWEHYWDLSANGPALAEQLIAAGKVDGVTSKAARSYVYTPVNKGAYFALVLSDDRTLWGFHASTVVGGNISERLISDFSMMQLKGIFQDIEERGLKIPTHYDAGHVPIVGGNGSAIPHY